MRLPLRHTLLALSALLILGCNDAPQQSAPKAPPPLSVETITVTKSAVPIWKQYTGMTKASSEQEVRARVSGVLEAVYFKDGQMVTKGDRLFKIEQGEYLAALDAAKAKKLQHEAALRLSLANVARYQPLVDEGLAPRATLEQYEAECEELKAAIAGDEAQINTAQLQLDYTIITAPISGRMSARRVDVGNLVGMGESTLLSTIMSVDPIYAYFSPSQDDVRLIQKYRNKEKPDAYIEVKGSMEAIRLDGHVDFADNSVDPLTSTITMRATIDNHEGKVLPGTFVYVNLFINDTYTFLMIPPEVIFTDQLGKYVYVVDEHSKAKRVDITTGYSSKYYVSVTEGLSDGDKLIISGLMKLKPGRSVTANDATATKGIAAILEQHRLQPQEH